MTAVDPAAAPALLGSLPELPPRALQHIPGSNGWPLVGTTLEMLIDPKGAVERGAERWGPVFRSYSFGRSMISLLGPEANQFILLDQAKLFSSAGGWNPVLERVFPRGLMLLDFDEHRLHRRALASAFKPTALRAYFNAFNGGMARGIANWLARSPELSVYSNAKSLTLDLASSSFLGADLGPELDAVKRALLDMIAASISVARRPIPGTAMYRGVKAREFMVKHFARQIAKRYTAPGDDIFSQLCRAIGDDEAPLTPQQIVDHMNFLLVAAHDTLASSFTSFVYYLAAHPAWQQRLRDEALALQLAPDEPLPHERLDELPLADMAFKECLRLIPPIPTLPRRAVRDTEFAGFHLPAGTNVNVNVLYTHRMPEVWPEPDRFDPLRFTNEAQRARHKFAFLPYGGGAHLCIGHQFATMQARCFAYHLLTRCELSLAPGYQPKWRYWPIPKPADGLRVRLKPR